LPDTHRRKKPPFCILFGFSPPCHPLLYFSFPNFFPEGLLHCTIPSLLRFLPVISSLLILFPPLPESPRPSFAETIFKLFYALFDVLLFVMLFPFFPGDSFFPNHLSLSSYSSCVGLPFANFFLPLIFFFFRRTFFAIVLLSITFEPVFYHPTSLPFFPVIRSLPNTPFPRWMRFRRWL